ncbi:MAG: hypothetical protein PVF15_11340 [Candidatus Bathyarchaeota archaeon]|jgi:hypothetical protein
MKTIAKTALFSMLILTVIYVVTVVYANSSAHEHEVSYTAFEYRLQQPPTEWYMPERLGIVEIIEYEETDTLHVVVDRRIEPFPLQAEQPVFRYKEKFYVISERWVTLSIFLTVKQYEMLAAGVLGLGWTFVGAFFIKERKARLEK